jgi:hypothetical protein
MVARFSMTSGSVVVLTGSDNLNFMHAVPMEPDVFGLRISVLFRAVTANWVDIPGQRMDVGGRGWVDVDQPFRPQPDVSHMLPNRKRKFCLTPLQRERLHVKIKTQEIAMLEHRLAGGRMSWQHTR